MYYLVSVHKLRACNMKFKYKACEVSKTKESTFVDDCFPDEHNEVVDFMDKLYLCTALSVASRPASIKTSEIVG